jgi:hypothetical protein
MKPARGHPAPGFQVDRRVHPGTLVAAPGSLPGAWAAAWFVNWVSVIQVLVRMCHELSPLPCPGYEKNSSAAYWSAAYSQISATLPSRIR